MQVEVVPQEKGEDPMAEKEETRLEAPPQIPLSLESSSDSVIIY